MGKQKTSKSTQMPGFPGETTGVRNVLTPFYATYGTWENPFYTPMASAFENIFDRARFQLPPETEALLSEAVATGLPYREDITQSPIYKGYQSAYRAFVEPALADVREQQSMRGALRGSDTALLESAAVGRIGEQMMRDVMPQILTEYQASKARQMQAIPLQYQAMALPAETFGRYATIAEALESPQFMYPLLQLATQYGTAGAGPGVISAGYTPGFQAGCCFIMLETGDFTYKVRKLRDQLFSPDSFVCKGYKKMARWLVPKMRKHTWLKKIVKGVMTHPIAKFSESYNPALIPVCLFWTGVWNLYGRL